MINRYLSIALVVLLLGGCSSTQQSKHYYQLPNMASTIEAKSSVPAQRRIQLTGVNLADYLNGLGIVYQTGEVNYVTANSNLWLGSLQQQLQQTLLDNLNASLAGWLITNHSSSIQPAKRLTVNVSAFHGRYDGSVVVRGEWILEDRHSITSQPFDIELKQPEDGYDSLVKTLAQAWLQLSEQIARKIA